MRVTDNGAPSLGDSRSFTILVSPAAELRVTGIGISIDNVVTLTWSSQAGKIYRVEFKNDLNSTTWNLLGEFNASGSATSATNNISGTLQRYYRIQQSN